MLRSLATRRALVLAVILTPVAVRPAGADPDPPTATLREAVVRADSANKKAAAYKAYFLRLGRPGLKDLQKDEDVGIALQAAWESHLKPVRRKVLIDYRANDVYDADELAKFVTFFKERTQAPVPDWWAKAVADVDLFPGRHHAFVGRAADRRGKPKDADAAGQKELAVTQSGDQYVGEMGGRSIQFPTDTFDRTFAESFAGVLGDKRSVVAAYTTTAGSSFGLAGFEAAGGRPTWRASVWGAGRTLLAGKGFHRMEMVEKDGVTYLFGMESHGAYAEAFDVASGKVQFRFCTCYWFDHSEAWGLK